MCFVLVQNQQVREQIGGAKSTIAAAYKRFRGIAKVETTQIDPNMKGE